MLDGAKRSEVLERVRAVVVRSLGIKETAVVEEARIFDDLGADSLDLVEMIMAIEEEFDIEIDDDAAEQMLTVGDAVDYVVNAT